MSTIRAAHEHSPYIVLAASYFLGSGIYMLPLMPDASPRPLELRNDNLDQTGVCVQVVCSIFNYSDNIANDRRKSSRMPASSMIDHHALRIHAEYRKPKTYPNPLDAIV